MADDPSRQQQPPPIYRPIPRRTFAVGSNDPAESSADPFAQPTPPPPPADLSSRSSDFLAQLNARLLRSARGNGNAHEDAEGRAPARNTSALNLTGSTLFGIYDDVGSSTAGERSVAGTPWGTGAETPARRSQDAGIGYGGGWENGLGSADGGLSMKKSARRGTASSGHGKRSSRQLAKPQRQGVWRYLVVSAKLAALFLFGIVYGVIVSHLHDTRELAAVQVDAIDRESWLYFACWGFAGVTLGSLLPYVDVVWGAEQDSTAAASNSTVQEELETEKEVESDLSEQWNDIVRSVGAFVGIAFAIRRLPWQSTLQLTLTLALVNPALWYILDRSKPGLSFSLVVTSILTSFIFLSNPDVLPSPSLPATTNITNNNPAAAARASRLDQSNMDNDSELLFAGVVSYETLAVVTWVGSVLFCSCVCFGSIGRRLAVLER